LERAKGAGNNETKELKKRMMSIEGYTAEWQRLFLGIQHFHPIYEQTRSGGSGGGGVAEVIVLLVCDAVSRRKLLPTFRNNTMVSSSDHILTLEDEINKLTRNIVNKLSGNATSRPRRTNSSDTPL